MLIKRINPLFLSNIKLFKYKQYLKFNTEALGLISNRSKNLDFLLSYNNLPIDTTNKQGFPTRLRRYANYNVKINEKDYEIHYTGKNKFKQDVPDTRRELREFTLLEKKYIKNDFILNLISKLSAMTIINSDIKINKLDISLHQVRQICYPNVQSHNSPEGIHQDGVDFIVSALVMNRTNIEGGESILYDVYKNEIYRTTLYPGEGIFQEDRKLWHFVTPIKSIDNCVGYRDILGIDINIIS